MDERERIIAALSLVQGRDEWIGIPVQQRPQRQRIG